LGYSEVNIHFRQVVEQLGLAYFSIEVAKLVTQPLWPSRVPFKMSCSVMMGGLRFLAGLNFDHLIVAIFERKCVLA
jgi:hypothetical protein